MTQTDDAGPASTARLRFRRWNLDDAEAILDMYSREDVYRFLGSTPRPVDSLEEAAERIGRWQARATPSRGLWAVLRIDHPGPPIGTVLLVPLPRTDGQATDVHEIGWHFHPDVWGHGFAAEAGTAVIDLARDTGLTEVRAVVFLDNQASVRVCERLGMSGRGLTREWYDASMLEFVQYPL
ncbi:MAG: GNAT family N-acetyltransferase [Actinomycetes bacterium]